jgi:two-component system chemotaxis sensor kinase CheA
MDRAIRAIFLEELEDVLRTIGGALERLDRSTGAERDRAALELRRGFHTLKGAAQAVGESAIAQTCERAESAIATQLADATTVAAIARDALPALQRALEDLLGAEAAARSRESAPVPPPPPLPAAHDEDGALPRQTTGRVAGEGETLRPEGGRDASTVRVAAERIDAILDAAEHLVATLTEARAIDLLESAREALETSRGAVEALIEAAGGETMRPLAERRAIARRAGTSTRESLALTEDGLRAARVGGDAVTRAAEALGAELRTLRIAPFGPIVAALEHAAAEAAATLGRQVIFRAQGADLEIDRQVRDELREPLIHMVRNAIDHGIEAPDERERAGKSANGTIDLELSIVGGEIHVTLRDDGRGLDRAAIRARARKLGWGENESDPLSLIFEPGLSTRAETGPISGRGIGLDVVRDRIARMHGRIDVHSVPGRGTRFRLRLPLSHGALRVVHARCRGVDALFPSIAVDGVRRVAESERRTIEGRLHAITTGEAPIPMARLDATLGLEGTSAASETSSVWVVASAGGRRVALGVDAVIGAEELVVHALGGRIHRISGVSGTTVLAGGRVGLLLDVDAIVRRAVPLLALPARAAAVARRVLVVDDSVTTRALQRALLESAGYEVVVAADGREALERLGESTFDAVVTDVEMPVLDGFELLERIRSLPRTRMLPVIMVTARDREADRRHAVDLGASAYVSKRDFDRERLLSTLEDFL